MYSVYVLFSPNHQKIYIGFTSDLADRFLSHNLYGKGYTYRWRPWVIVIVERFNDKLEAMAREKELKSGQGRAYIEQHLEIVGLISA